MGPLGVPELIFIFVLALLIFGPKKLPELGRTVGKALGEFRRATNDLKRTFNTELALEESPAPPQFRPRRVEVEAPAVPPREAPALTEARPAESTAAPAAAPEPADPE